MNIDITLITLVLGVLGVVGLIIISLWGDRLGL